MKKYKIKTIQDMVDCTNQDNLDAFLVDLKLLIMGHHLLRTMAQSIGEDKIIVEDFTWIDDGKNDVQILLEKKNNK